MELDARGGILTVQDEWWSYGRPLQLLPIQPKQKKDRINEMPSLRQDHHGQHNRQESRSPQV